MAHKPTAVTGAVPDGAESEPNGTAATKNVTELSLPAEQDIESEILNAELVLWRVFGCSNEYVSRPEPNWSVDQARGPGSNDHLLLSLGDFPDELTITLRRSVNGVPSPVVCWTRSSGARPSTTGCSGTRRIWRLFKCRS